MPNRYIRSAFIIQEQIAVASHVQTDIMYRRIFDVEDLLARSSAFHFSAHQLQYRCLWSQTYMTGASRLLCKRSVLFVDRDRTFLLCMSRFFRKILYQTNQVFCLSKKERSFEADKSHIWRTRTGSKQTGLVAERSSIGSSSGT